MQELGDCPPEGHLPTSHILSFSKLPVGFEDEVGQRRSIVKDLEECFA